MSRTKWVLTVILALVLIVASVVLYDVLSDRRGQIPQIVELQRTLLDVLDEDELKQELQVIHPVLPADRQSRYQLYVTPDDDAVVALASDVSGPRQCYDVAVQWTWVSDQTLNGVKEKWLMPHGFLVDTPDYPRNPVKPRVVSDCEEQANSLASLLRADGVSANDVRVVLGKVDFGGEIGGHAWVEVWYDSQWVPLEATSGPYWDDEKGRWFSRAGYPFQHFADNEYPRVEVWAYYNDVYFLDPRDGSGNAPASWRLLHSLE